MILGVDHLLLAMPIGQEKVAREFCEDILELIEIPKPETLAHKGGVWFALPDGRQLHYGTDASFMPAQKAHPAFICEQLDELAYRLAQSNFQLDGIPN